MGMAVGRNDEDQILGDRLGGLSRMLDSFTSTPAGIVSIWSICMVKNWENSLFEAKFRIALSSGRTNQRHERQADPECDPCRHLKGKFFLRNSVL